MQSPGFFKADLPMQTAAVATGNGTVVTCIDDQGAYKVAGIQITGISGDTITFEATIDGTNWVALRCTPIATGTVATTATADGIYQVDVTGLYKIRARVSTYSAGTITVTCNLSAY